MKAEYFFGFVVGCVIGWVIGLAALNIWYDEIMDWLSRVIEKIRSWTT